MGEQATVIRFRRTPHRDWTRFDAIDPESGKSMGYVTDVDHQEFPTTERWLACTTWPPVPAWQSYEQSLTMALSKLTGRLDGDSYIMER